MHAVGGERIRVLYVDDEAAFADLVTESLRAVDDRLVVEAVRDAETALERLDAGDVDCVVSELALPGMDGLALLRAVRQRHGALPFVLFTGRGSEAVASEAIGAGVTDYLRKRQGTEGVEALARRIRRAVAPAHEGHDGRGRSAAARLDLVMESAPIVLFNLDPEGVVTEVDGRGLEALATPPEAIVGRHVAEFCETTAGHAVVSRALDGVEGSTVLTVDDLVYQTWLRPVFAADGSVDGAIGVAFDVTAERRRTERLEALSGSTRDLLYAADVDEVRQTVVDIADAVFPERLVAFWAHDRERDVLVPEAVSASAAAFVAAHPDTEPREIHPDHDEWAAFETASMTVVEDYRALANASHPGAPLGTVLFAPVGEEGLLAVAAEGVAEVDDFDRLLLDILSKKAAVVLERAHNEAALAAYRRELERSNESLQEFAYIASHDLQEPLRMVSSYVELLAEDYGGQLDAEADQYIHFAVDGAKRMQAMIEALLDYSRVSTRGKEREPVEADDVLGETLAALSILIEDRGVEVHTDRLPRVEADASQLGQLFQNLVGNAIQYGGTEVTVTGEETEEGWHFTISDNGPGVPPHQQERIFDLFARGDRHGGPDGTGIGLAICERIVHRHGGDIWVESEGEGATFHFTIARPGTSHAEVAI